MFDIYQASARPHNTWLEPHYAIHTARGRRSLCKNGQPDAAPDGRVAGDACASQLNTSMQNLPPSSGP